MPHFHSLHRIFSLIIVPILITACWFSPKSIDTTSQAKSYDVKLLQSEYSQEVEQAILLADGVLDLMGLELPQIVIIPGTKDAMAMGDVIYIGELLATELSPIGLAQVILHEAGHVFEGHTDVALNELLSTLRENNLVPPEILDAVYHQDEFSADMWSAVAAWVLDPNPSNPEFVAWLAERNEPASDTHPDSATRAELIREMVQGLYEAESQGVISPESMFSLVHGQNAEFLPPAQSETSTQVNQNSQEPECPDSSNDSAGDDSGGGDPGGGDPGGGDPGGGDPGGGDPGGGDPGGGGE